MDADAGVMQAVVTTLADEDGLRCVRELVEQDFDSMPSNRKGSVFSTQVLPFLETVTHPNVLSSLVLESSVGTIYNVLFGLNGDRAAKILSFIGDAISREAIGETKSWQLEVSLLFFSRLVDLNSTALIQEHLQEQAKKFEAELALSMRSGETDSKLHRAKACLERLRRRLSIGQSLPVSLPGKNTQPAVPTATFVPIRDVPGGRHDNDHADICEIKIMPTFQEIQSTSTEYLPVIDPTQWHIDGLDGLIDRNFRLLREDTVGQLRDAVHQFLSQQNPLISSKSVLRKNVYCDAQATKIDFDSMSGFQFELKFPQPTGLKGKSAKQREAWWRDSKRLQPGALVCLVTHRNMVLFCIVAENTLPRKSKDSADRDSARGGSLWEDPKFASVMLTLVYSGPTNLKFILHLFSSKTPASLVEFPGVLLGAFEPTLEALKQMKSAGNVPFSELLIAWNRGTPGSNLIPPPVYSLAPGFAFNLRCLMSNNANFYVHPNRPVNLQALCANSSLDHSQAKALVSCLQRKLGLIQGPPGTGKSYTGIALVKVLLANLPRRKASTGPIICVTFTNHALDQLLEAFLDNNITTQIVRIGSQSQSTKLAPFNLNAIAGESKRTKLEKELSWMAHRDMDECERDFRDLGLKSDLEDRVVPHIRQYYPNHYQQLFGMDDEGFQIVTTARPSSAIKHWVDAGIPESTPPRAVNKLRETNVFDMSQGERQKLHQHWIYEVRDEIHGEIVRISRLQAGARARLDHARDEYQLRCLSQADIVGMTTTGLARRLNMLRKLQSKVILCEEAGEVLESHLLTALLPSVEHAILIGDHQQLSPKVANYELSRSNHQGGSQYSLDLSLFERLVDSGETPTSSPMSCGHPYATLETQRRMHPSIAQLVRDTLYPNLEDAPSVSEYPEVTGMRKRLFWLDHRVPENDSSEADGNSTSHWNSHEINMTLALVNHLVQQGEYKEQDIAVLTPYLGQLHRLRQALGRTHALMLGERDQEDLNKAGFEDDPKEESNDQPNEDSSIVKESLLRVLRVATVDNFQGEEAKIVVISLVRSNPQQNCGFLRTSNRINVLLSRARHGMYIIGNSETSNRVPMWAQVIEILRQGGNIGENLALQCPRHPDTSINVSQPDDFRRFSPEGGCDLRCDKRLRCGHACAQKCHSDVLHGVVFCLEPCPRPRTGCSHPCPKLCGDTCPSNCTINVFKEDRVLKCSHPAQNLPCWQDQDESTVRCPVLVDKVVPGCKHVVNVACHVDVDSMSFECTIQCRGSLPCGHNCKAECYRCISLREDGTVLVNHVICQQPCGRLYSTCSHRCASICHGKEQDCPPCQANCEVSCGHSKCPQKCCEPCTPCAESKCLSACPHSLCSMPCAAPCDHVPCSLQCEKFLECGHQCPSICGEECPSSTYCQVCGDEDIKNREVDFILGEPYKDIDLNVNPCIFPQCGHFITMESMDAQMDIKKHYDVDENERPIAIIASLQPFSLESEGGVKLCAECRGPLRNIARYGRLVRRALLDESTKKLVLYLNREYVPLAKELPGYIRELQEATSKGPFKLPESVELSGSGNKQIDYMEKIIGASQPKRWQKILQLRAQIKGYCRRVKPAEQPFQRVRDMVVNAQRRKMTTGDFKFDSSVLQTKGILQATALSFRLDIALFSDFLTLLQEVRTSETNPLVDLQILRKECSAFIDEAERHKRPVQQVEGHVFLAQLYALELPYSAPETAETHLEHALNALGKARDICSTWPGQTAGLKPEVESAEKMLHGGTFYTEITSEERMAVINAMAKEFQGTGHWYYCRNGHPFTIGECGGAIQLASCPECGAPVGGQNHRAAGGVTRANDLEADLVTGFARLGH